MKKKIQNYFRNAYGFDLLSKHIYYLAIVSFVITLFYKNRVFSFIALFLLTLSLIRTLSNKRSARLRELALYTRLIRKAKVRFKIIKLNLTDREYKYLMCKSCLKQLRVPRKKGKIIVTCSNCRAKIDVKS
ncbi:MAG: hypothetical protein GX074_01655 [Erysipelothrix sp.]|nr:hypothetical protein [Erysipelothrix sp.]